MSNSVALVVEDDMNTSLAYSRMLETMGYSVHLAHSLNQAKSHVEELKPTIVLLDLGLPDGSGLDLLKQYSDKSEPKPQFVVITGAPSQEAAVDCLRARADDFLSKPISLKKLRGCFGQLQASRQSANDDAVGTRKNIPTHKPRQSVVFKGNSMSAHQLREVVHSCANSELNAMITGAVGVEKSSVAYALHTQSHAQGDFVWVFGSDLATHATDCIPTLLQAAKGGTFVISDISSMPLVHQATFCSQLRQRDLHPSNFARPENTKIVAIIHEDWETAVAEGRLNQELYHRIAEFTIKVPNLKDRSKDIPEMANAILRQLNQTHKVVKRFTPDSLARLENYTWPGNIRELNNVIRQGFAGRSMAIAITQDLALSGSQLEQENGCIDSLIGKTFWETEKALLFATLDSVGGDKTTAAQMLGISLKTLYNRLKAYS